MPLDCAFKNDEADTFSVYFAKTFYKMEEGGRKAGAIVLRREKDTICRGWLRSWRKTGPSQGM